MRTFTIEPHPNKVASCKNWIVLRSDDNKIHAHSKSKRTLNKIKEKMENYLTSNAVVV